MIDLSTGRGRAEWGRTATLAAHVHRSMTGQNIDPNDLMPPSLRATRAVAIKSVVDAKTPEEVRREGAAIKAMFLRHTATG